MKAYQIPVTEIISLNLTDGILKNGDNNGEPFGSYDVEPLIPDPDMEEIGGDDVNVFSKSLWEE